MRILVFGLSSNLGGVESFIIENCSNISDYDPEMIFEYLVIDSIPGYISESTISASTFHVVPNRVKHFLKYQKRLDQIIDKGKYDCIWYNACTLSDITLLERAREKVPRRIIHSHSSKNLGSFANRVLHEMHKVRIRRLATDFVACSYDAGTFMFPDFNPANKDDFIYRNSIDGRIFRRDIDSIESAKEAFGLLNNPVFLHIGRFSSEKNHEFLIELIKRLRTELPNAKLLLVGDGPRKKEIIDLVKQNGLENNVSFLGSRKDIPAILNASDVFLLPSLHEGFPITLLEAQAAGLQCIGSTNIPEDAYITTRAKRLSLDSPSIWIDACISSYEHSLTQTDDCCEIIKDKGFDIKTNSKIMHQFFSDKDVLQAHMTLGVQ